MEDKNRLGVHCQLLHVVSCDVLDQQSSNAAETVLVKVVGRVAPFDRTADGASGSLAVLKQYHGRFAGRVKSLGET